MSDLPKPDLIDGTAFDFELIVSRESPIGIKSGKESGHSIPVFFDYFRNKFYLSLCEEDDDYYKEVRNANKELLVESTVRPELLEYPRNDPRYSIKRPMHDILEIPGVVGDPFILQRGNREYWRFKFFKESIQDVSSFIMTRESENDMLSGMSFSVENLGKPKGLLNYFKQLNYGRKVSMIVLREEINKKYLQKAPHYQHPFSFVYKTANIGQGFSRTVRISKGKSQGGGLIKEQKTVREGETFITEDKRDSIMDAAYFDFEKRFFLPFIGMQCDYDGKLSTTTAILDSFKLLQFLSKIKEINDFQKGAIKFVVESVDMYYEP